METLRALHTTTQPETADAEGLKNEGIGQSAAEPLCRKAGEGPTTRAYHLQPQGMVMKPVGRLEAPEAPGSRRNRWDEDIV